MPLLSLRDILDFLCVLQTISMISITLTCEHVTLVDKWCLFCAHSKNYLILLAASD